MVLQVGTQYTNHTQIALAALSVPKPNRLNPNSQGRSNATGSVVRFNARIAKQHCGIPDPPLHLKLFQLREYQCIGGRVNWVLHTGHKGNTPSRGASLLHMCPCRKPPATLTHRPVWIGWSPTGWCVGVESLAPITHRLIGMHPY